MEKVKKAIAKDVARSIHGKKAKEIREIFGFINEISTREDTEARIKLWTVGKRFQMFDCSLDDLKAATTTNPFQEQVSSCCNPENKRFLKARSMPDSYWVYVLNAVCYLLLLRWLFVL